MFWFSKPPTKVVFLDYDGVFFTYRALLAEKNPKYQTTPRWNFSIPDPLVIRFLNDICKPDTAIVITSSWKSHDNDEARRVLRKSGFKKRIHKDWHTKDGPTWKKRRGEGIDAWLKDHPEVKDHIIIDDDFDFLHEEQLKRTVPCDGYNGLSMNGMLIARHLLFGEELNVFHDDRPKYFLRGFKDSEYWQKHRRELERKKKIHLWRIRTFGRNLKRMKGKNEQIEEDANYPHPVRLAHQKRLEKHAATPKP